MPIVVLRSEDLHWIDRAADNLLTDQCVHGEVEFRVGGDSFVVPGGGDWNLTAAGLFLLRTLADDNTASDTVCEDNYLIPCCGFNPWTVTGYRYPVLIQGCNRGVSVSVVHEPSGIRLHSVDGVVARISEAEWRNAVLGFTAEIEAWYAQNPPRATPDDKSDAEGWQALWQEWNSRREAAAHAA